MDSAAEFVVTVGGFVVLSAVLGICFYLAWVVVPLFAGGGNEESGSGVVAGGVPRAVVLDPYGQAMGMVGDDGVVRTLLLGTGEIVGSVDLAVDGAEPSVVMVGRNGQLVAVGYGDGRVRLGTIGFEATLLDAVEDDEPIQAIEHGYIETLEAGQRRVELAVAVGDPVKLKSGSGAVVALDYRTDPTGKKTLVALRADGTVLVNSVRTIRPLGGGAARTKLRSSSFVLDPERSMPRWIFVSGDGRQVFTIWEDGHLERYTKVGSDFLMVERVGLVDPGVRVTTATMLLGARTLMVGDDEGSTSAFHLADDAHRRFADEKHIVRAHKMRSADGAVVQIAVSVRDRTIAIVHANGYVDVRYESSEKHITRYQPEVGKAVVAAIMPKNDGVVTLGDEGAYAVHSIELGYPEFSVNAVFGKVHYEGGEEPEYVYQSSAGDDASEVKMSIVPLVFGTLKATVFAMMFAIPVAVLAAMYSSEFLSKRVRRVVKPSVELMASLPSVVLGFMAAIVVAPFVERHLAGFVLGIVVVPLTVLLAAHVWQMVPMARRRRLRSGQHFALVLMTLIVGGVLSAWIGPGVIRGWFVPDEFDAAMIAEAYEPVGADEVPSWAQGPVLTVRQQRRLRGHELGFVDGVVVEPVGEVDRDAVMASVGLEGGDLQRWLNGEYGRAWAGWTIVLFPVFALVVWLVQGVTIRRRMDGWLADKEALFVGTVVLGKLVALCSVSLGSAFVVGLVLERFGFDPRDSIFGTFSPRNTLVVALIMGFAVIPIIYTISEDALQAVPNTLRSASLGAGATPWQTAVRIVLPVAGSGIFSACMIGFGRAVGETMIVLMATGNTPEMSWNVFSGFRTLAANIAVEIPEAPKDQTHYRVLFLCGLVLFVMTFVINTLAEVVRRVVRARNAGL